MENHLGVSHKDECTLTLCPSSSVPTICPTEMCTIFTKRHAGMFMATLLAVVLNWKALKCPSAVEYKSILCCTHTWDTIYSNDLTTTKMWINLTNKILKQGSQA